MLYDHSTDPDENENICEMPENSEVVEHLSRLIREHRGEDYFEPLQLVYTDEDK
jgi:hypothetical protein